MEESNLTVQGSFSIKVRVGQIEIEVSAPEKDFVLNESTRLIEQFQPTSTVSPITDQTEEALNGEKTMYSSVPETKLKKPQALAEFYNQFANLQTNLDKTLVLGYWCELKQGQSHFTFEDIEAKYREIRVTPPANLQRDLRSLHAKGLLMPPEKSDNGVLAYVLTNSGIKEVESKIP